MASKNKDLSECINVCDSELVLLEAKKQSYFLRIKNIHDTIPKNREDPVFDLFFKKISNLDNIRSEFNCLVEQINKVSLTLNPKFLVNFEAIWAFEDFYCEIKDAAKKYSLTQSNNLQFQNNDLRNNIPTSSIRLEKLSVPEFYGEYEKFPMFIESFNSMIHFNNELTDSLRIRYLISKLKGKSESIWLGINPTADNYLLIYNALVDKYTDNRAIAVSYLEKLLNLKPLHNATAIQLDSFIDQYSTSIAALKQLKIDDLLDFIFVHLGLRKLDMETAKQYENTIRKQCYPQYSEFVIFLREQLKILQRTSNSTNYNTARIKNNSSKMAYSPRDNPTAYIVNTSSSNNCKTSPRQCSLCKSSEHGHLFSCPVFTKQTPHDKYNTIKNLKGCINCLSTRHTLSNCNSNSTCKDCNKRHHTTLHFTPRSNMVGGLIPPNISAPVAYDRPRDSTIPNDKPVALHSNSESTTAYNDNKIVLLGSAIVYVLDRNSIMQPVRVLIDMGSQKHFISKQCCKKLGLNINQPLENISVKGIGDNSQSVQGLSNVTLYSRFNNFQLNLQALVLNKISSNLPQAVIDRSSLDYLFNLPLADENFFLPGRIDMLIGSDVFAQILKGNKVLGNEGNPDALETEFGYIIIGSAKFLKDLSMPSANLNNATYHSYFCNMDNSIENLMDKFLNVEEVPHRQHMSPADKQCELIYTENISRDNTGRFMTVLPFSRSSSELGDSMNTASRRYSYLERKFTSNEILRLRYDAVIREYLEKGYISRVESDTHTNRGYVIPHHGVLRDDKLSTKLRIVLDASSKTSSGLSLNDCLYPGPNLQNDLTAIIINFRLFRVAISADIKQMFLQILVHPDFRKFLRILYRFPGEDKPSLYEFNRVCFGLSCSPYLAMRTIRELAQIEKNNYPRASQTAQKYLFMDDLGTSVCTPQEGVDLSIELINMFLKGGFELVKFISNSPAFLNSIPQNHTISQIEFNENDDLKILGLKWCPKLDRFYISVKEVPQTITKRVILSTIARLWDINGFCAPVILKAKLIMKSLWLERIDWDEQPPQYIIDIWDLLRKELPLLSKLYIPRYLGINSYDSKIIIVGFSDASERGYGAAVYLCVVDSPLNKVNLVVAKSKVAPASNKMLTLCRLELCALLLLAKLIRFVIDTVSSRCNVSDVYAFTDSTVAMYWAHSSPHRFQTYVANRIAQIQEYLSPQHIFHVNGKENPSDCLSRGLLPSQILEHPLWMHGPHWLQQPVSEWPTQRFAFNDHDFNDSSEYERKNNINVFTTTVNEPPFLYTVASRTSSWSKLLRIIVYIYRFVKRIPRSHKMEVDHLNQSKLEILRSVQQVHYADVLLALKNNRELPKPLNSLSPFIHTDGLIRVGGRLQNTNLNYNTKHPILLPKQDHIVNLLIDYHHVKYLHSGPHLLLSLLRQEYWIVSGRSVVRKRFQSCNKCFRANPKPKTTFMSNLPPYRVQECKPFLKTGVDYAGPFSILLSRYRGARQQKAYICLFTCLVTRAVHIELAVDLSTDAFIKAFRRFVSRRGDCLELFSDNGTNFVGAKAHFEELKKFIKSTSFKEAFLNETTNRGISWHMITPNAPHFGGAWETNIKSVKQHLKRVVGETLLTYEEFLTVLTQIECILNSRPLSVLSSDPTEPTALTPAHFLTLGPLDSFHAVDTSLEPPSLLKRKHLLDKFVQSYWSRWKNEYLTTLQNRQKWNTRTNPITIGTVVILKSDNLAVLQWPIGIITNVHPGSDGLIRVVTVRTRTGSYTRPVVKVCPLPTQ